ncbi:MAG: lysophospholipid acyltransferase family protein [Atribacterota bacterium]|nr:lysophospholipid acyltransferase family protein [Atribacterota bacterium]MDD4895391.1 lysophospholipid acyltransferase family protein [Atribacterota bacterium]MDD5637434.1 lysophospholipid acyltransferase family protein [Atribacterota bacterium]
MNKGHKKLPNKMVSRIVLSSLKWYLGTFFCLQLERNDTCGLNPPYLLIGNHANFWDGFLANLFIKDPICFLVSDEYFRKPILRRLLEIEGSIPKKKFLADFSAIKEALRAKETERIIGIFPEGRRNWDGSVQEIIFATAKLIKMLKIPVVRVLLKGSYLTFPRWARFKRKGKIILNYKLIMMPDKIQEMSVDNIFQKITASLTYREYDFQRKAMNIYQGRNLAERLELFLYFCPNCQEIGTLYSRGDDLFCRRCNYEVRYDQYGFLTTEGKQLYFDNPADWNQWQIDWSKNFLRNYQKNDYKGNLVQDEGVNCAIIKQFKKLKPLPDCKLIWQGRELILTKNEKEYLRFELKEIKGINVQYNNRFEFYYKEQLYQFYFNSDSISAYKWCIMIRLAQQIFF